MDLKRSFAMRCFLIIFSLTLTFNLQSAFADNTKMAIFVARYKAFKLEFENFWNKANNTDVGNAKTNLDLGREFLNFQERLNDFDREVKRYALDQLEAGKINEVEEHHFALLSATINAMYQTIDSCQGYLSYRKEVYLQAATKYFQILLFLENHKE